MKLLDCFERLYVISLPHQVERRRRLGKRLENSGLASEKEVIWIRGISGYHCPPPLWFDAGPGAWGCLQSHLRLVQDAIMDQVESYCVLEDDVIFSEHSGMLLDKLMSDVPEDWDQIYLGGHHLLEPEIPDPDAFVFRCRNVNRTHAFSLRKGAFEKFQQHIINVPDYLSRERWHLDHQLGLAHEGGLWNTYAPRWWLAGQEEGISNVSEKLNPRLWWHYSAYSLRIPLIFVGRGMSASLKERVSRFVCTEMLHERMGSSPGNYDDPGFFRSQLNDLAIRALHCGKLPGIIGSDDLLALLQANWPAGAITAEKADLEGLAAYPFNGLFAGMVPLPAGSCGEQAA